MGQTLAATDAKQDHCREHLFGTVGRAASLHGAAKQNEPAKGSSRGDDKLMLLPMKL
jgi:hypothetical protein